MDFGDVVWGQSSSLEIQVTNNGNEIIEVTDIISSSEDFTIFPTSFQISPGDLILITVIFLPSYEGEIGETITFTFSDGIIEYNLTANSVNLPIFGPSPFEFNFDVIQSEDSLETQILTITNHGHSELTWEAEGISVDDRNSNEMNILIASYSNSSYYSYVVSAINNYQNNDWSYDGELITMNYFNQSSSSFDNFKNNVEDNNIAVIIFPSHNYFTSMNGDNETEGLYLKEFMEDGGIVVFNGYHNDTDWNILDYSENGGAGIIKGNVAHYTDWCCGENDYNYIWQDNWYIPTLEINARDFPIWSTAGGNVAADYLNYYSYYFVTINNSYGESNMHSYHDGFIPFHNYNYGDNGWISFAQEVGEGLFYFHGDREPQWSGDNYETNKTFIGVIQWAFKTYGNPNFLSISEESGTVNPLSSIEVEITADTRDLNFGPYSDNFIINSNDPNYESIEIPVTLEVRGPVFNPEPDSLEFDIYLAYDSLVTQPLSIINEGWADLVWEAEIEPIGPDLDYNEMNILIASYSSSSYYNYVVSAINNYQNNDWSYDGHLIEMNYFNQSSSSFDNFTNNVENNDIDVIIFPHDNHFTNMNQDNETEGLYLKQFMEDGGVVAFTGYHSNTDWNVLDYSENGGAGIIKGNVYHQSDWCCGGNNRTNYIFQENWYIPALNTNVQVFPVWTGGGGNVSASQMYYYSHYYVNIDNSWSESIMQSNHEGFIPLHNYSGSSSYWVDFVQEVGDGLFYYHGDREPQWSGDSYETNKTFIGVIQWAFKRGKHIPTGTISSSELLGSIPVENEQVIEITADYINSDFGIDNSVIKLTSNDPYIPSIDIPVKSNIYFPIADLDTSIINFNEVGFTDTVEINLPISNFGNYTMEVNCSLNDSSLTLSSYFFEVEPDSTYLLNIIVSTDNYTRIVEDQLSISTTEIGFPVYVIDISAIVVPDLNPVILSISDRPADQGGYAFINFTRSYEDEESPQNSPGNRDTEFYTIWYEENENWISIATIGALADEHYTALIPTAVDSSSDNLGIYNYRVSAHMEEGTWISESMSGYSIDNIVPTTPTLQSVNQFGINCNLEWNHNLDEDLSHYLVFRNEGLLTTTIQNSFIDESIPFGIELNYLINAVDIHGNISENSNVITIYNSVGDVNSDNQLNIFDLILIVGEILQINDYPFDENQFLNADVNDDGAVNVADIVELVSIILDENDAMSKTVDEIIVYKKSNGLFIENSGLIGFDISVSHLDEMNIDISKNALLADSKSNIDNTRIIIVNPEDDYLFLTNNEFMIESINAFSKNGEIDVQVVIVPDNFELSSAYPNPFNPETSIKFGLPEEMDVNVKIYDMSGKFVDEIVNQKLNAGFHHATWNATNQASGVYFISVQAGQNIETRKIVLLK